MVSASQTAALFVDSSERHLKYQMVVRVTLLPALICVLSFAAKKLSDYI